MRRVAAGGQLAQVRRAILWEAQTAGAPLTGKKVRSSFTAPANGSWSMNAVSIVFEKEPFMATNTPLAMDFSDFAINEGVTQ